MVLGELVRGIFFEKETEGANRKDKEPFRDGRGSVVQWLGRWTCNQQVAGSTAGRRIAE